MKAKLVPSVHLSHQPYPQSTSVFTHWTWRFHSPCSPHELLLISQVNLLQNNPLMTCYHPIGLSSSECAHHHKKSPQYILSASIQVLWKQALDPKIMCTVTSWCSSTYTANPLAILVLCNNLLISMQLVVCLIDSSLYFTFIFCAFLPWTTLKWIKMIWLLTLSN
jgi:hypothetical protein